MNKLDALKYVVSADRAESEIDFIEDIYRLPENFENIAIPANRTIRILIGKKGSGKSALLEYIKICCNRNQIPCVKLKADDIIDEDFSESASPAIIKKTVFESIIKKIAITLGGRIDAGKGKEENAVKSQAQKEGEDSIELDIAKKGLLEIGTAISGVELSKIFTEKEYSIAAIKKSISAVSEKLPTVSYVLIDDVDQSCLTSNKNYLEVIWGFLQGAQKVAEDFPNIKVIIAYRSEIWLRLKLDDNSGRDQIDHYRNRVEFINPTRDDLFSVLANRLRYCCELLGMQTRDVYEPFFESHNCKLPTSDERRLWKDYLVSSCRFRPRDLTQLLYKLIISAQEKGKDIITDSDIENVAYQYSWERVEDVINENIGLCGSIDAIIRSFIKLDFEPTAIQLRDHIKSIPGYNSKINQKLISRNKYDDDFYSIWRLLFDCEFITPRLLDSSEERGFVHIRPYQDPELVSKARWDDMNKYYWDIHPAYRSFLVFEQNKEKRYQAQKKVEKTRKSNK